MPAMKRTIWICLALAIRHSMSLPFCQTLPTVELSLGDCRILSEDKAKSDIKSWGIKVTVGDSNEICVVPSTAVNSTFWTSSEICDDDQLDMSSVEIMKGIKMTREQCLSRRGGVIDPGTAPSASTEGLEQLNPGWIKLKNKITAAVKGNLRLLANEVAFVQGLITEGQFSTNSHLGLAAGSTLLQRLYEEDIIQSRSWGLNVGSQSSSDPRSGSLVLGGLDKSSLAGPLYEYDVAVPDILEDRYCPLQITLTGLTLSTAFGDVPFADKGRKLDACIEP